MFQFEPNQEFAGKYTLIERIGEGGFAEVWKVQRASGFIQAIKIFSGLSAGGADLARKEFERIYNLNHPNLLKPSDWGVYKQHPFLVLPFCSHGNALKLAGKVDEKTLVKIIYDISSALEYLHSREDPIIHQDVKPDNILIDENYDFLLSDFGISKKLKITFAKNTPSTRETARMDDPVSAGTTPPAYRPPEYYSTVATEKKPIKASDIWAFGITIYELATTELAFGEYGGLFQKQGQPTPDLPIDKFSSGLSYLVHWCLEENPSDRPTANELKEMAHHYLTYGSWDAPEQPVTGPAAPIERSAAELSAPLEKENRPAKWWFIIPFVLLIGGLGYFLLGNVVALPGGEDNGSESLDDLSEQLYPPAIPVPPQRYNESPTGRRTDDSAAPSANEPPEAPDETDDLPPTLTEEETEFIADPAQCAWYNDAVAALMQKDKATAKALSLDQDPSGPCDQELKTLKINLVSFERTEKAVNNIIRFIERKNLTAAGNWLKRIQKNHHPAFTADISTLQQRLQQLAGKEPEPTERPNLDEQRARLEKLQQFYRLFGQGEDCLREKDCDCAELAFTTALELNINNEMAQQKLEEVKDCKADKAQEKEIVDTGPSEDPEQSAVLEGEEYHCEYHNQYDVTWRAEEEKRLDYKKRSREAIIVVNLAQQQIQLRSGNNKVDYSIQKVIKDDTAKKQYLVRQSGSGTGFTVTIDLQENYIDFQSERDGNKAKGDRFYLK